MKLLLLSFFVPLISFAQAYTSDWGTFAAASGASAGGVYSEFATVGQTAISGSSSEAYTEICGFWSILQLPGSTVPQKISVERDRNTVRLSWEAPEAAFVLEQTSVLSAEGSAPWQLAPANLISTGNQTTAILPVTARTMFFRLKSVQ